MKSRDRMRGLLEHWVWVACALAWILAPRDALALKQPLCSNVTCTGGTPVLNAGGTGLTHPEIVPIFWGSYWNSSTNPTRTSQIGAVQALVNGAYFAALGQYGANGNWVGQARMAPMAPTYTATTPVAHCANGATCTNKCSDGSLCGVNDVTGTINAVIGSGAVPGPVANVDFLYLLFVPPGFTTFDANGRTPCTSSCGSTYNGKQYNFAWVNGGDIPGLTHELAENIAGNATNTNCHYTSDGSAANQIADLCGCYTEPQLGGSYSAYWSASDGKCVIPEAWSGVYQYNNTGTSWTQIGGAARQVYAGGYGLIATDTNDNIQRYTGVPMIWAQIGNTGAMFAVGSGGLSTILATDVNASAVYYYTGTGTNWNVVGGPPTSLVAGNFLYATDYNGLGAIYSPSTNQWTGVSGATDQVVATNNGLVGLTIDHSSVWLNTAGTSSGWVRIGNAASELFAGASNIGATALAASKDIFYYQGSGSNWVDNGGPGNGFAITTSNTLFGLSPNRSFVAQSSNVNATQPAWTTIGGSGGRLVGHGNALYATLGINY